MAPEVSEKESADWGNALEAVLVDDPTLTSSLSSLNLFFATPTSIDNGIGESVGTIPEMFFVYLFTCLPSNPPDVACYNCHSCRSRIVPTSHYIEYHGGEPH